MIEREMLGFAAKAAGHSVITWVPDSDHVLCLHVQDRHGLWLEWNPIEDNSDAFQLRVYLGLSDFDIARQKHLIIHELGLMDTFALERLAITRLAAKIGKAME